MQGSAEEYIRSLEPVVGRHFAPNGLYRGLEGALVLARDIGYGLADYPQKQIDDIIGTLYSRMLVRHCLHGKGVPIDNKPWVAEIRKSIDKRREGDDVASKSGEKGKRFEREIAKTFSEWCGFTLIRTPMSGAWSGSNGDIVPESRTNSFPICVECKHHKDFDFSLLLRSKGIIISWINQAVSQSLQDSQKNNQITYPLIIFKKDRQKPFVIFPYRILEESVLELLDVFILMDYKSNDFIVTPLELFLKYVPYQLFLKVSN